MKWLQICAFGAHVCAIGAIGGLALSACDGQSARLDGQGTDNLPAPGVSDPGAEVADPATQTPPPNTREPSACDLRVSELAVYQGVKVPLAMAGSGGLVAAPTRSVDLVVGRDAFFRVFVDPGPTNLGARARARLVLSSAAGQSSYEDDLILEYPSEDVKLNSTFNFRVPGSAIFPDTRLRVEVLEPTACAALASQRFPINGDEPLRARRTGLLKVRLVPIEYQADGSGRVPDMSEAQVKRYRDLLTSMFPVTSVEFDIRETVKTDQSLTGNTGWADLLDGLRKLREQDQVAPDIHYYGLVNPAASFQAYCGRACTAGIAYVTAEKKPSLRVGLGIGFSGQFAAQTLAHEVGHQHGRLHAPCNVDGDSHYPHAGGRIGTWGFDLNTDRLFDPAQNADVMGYCNPSWVSDYTYQGLLEQLVMLNGAPQALALTIEGTWRVLLVDEAGKPRWGQPIEEPTPAAGEKEVAQVLGESGEVIAQVDVYRTAMADTGTSMVMIPDPEPNWAAIQVKGAQPHRFDAPIATPTLR